MTDRSVWMRTRFLAAIIWSPEDQAEIERVFEWAQNDPDRAAQYIVWLEKAQDDWLKEAQDE